MSGIVTWNTGGRRAVVILVACVVGVWLASLAAGPTAADEGDSDQASAYILQAIGCIVSTPNDMDQIQEKIDDALKAPDTEGVDLTQVQAAMDALDNGDMDQARTLLQESLKGVAPAPAAAGEETGTTVVHDPVDPRGSLSGGDWILLAISALVVALGAWLAVRYRPHESVRVLRRQLGTPPNSTSNS